MGNSFKNIKLIPAIFLQIKSEIRLQPVNPKILYNTNNSNKKIPPRPTAF